MAEKLLLFGPIIEAAHAQAARDAEFQAFCDRIVALSEQHDARPRSLSNEQMLRLEREYYADDLPSNKEEHEAALEHMRRLHRATCPREIREQAQQIVEAIMPQKI